jgi:hypothetical protein
VFGWCAWRIRIAFASNGTGAHEPIDSGYEPNRPRAHCHHGAREQACDQRPWQRRRSLPHGARQDLRVGDGLQRKTHPSLPNYLALTSGSTAGISTDCNPPGGACTAAVRNIADEVVASGRSWRMYAEGMPAPCATHNVGEYAVKHVPFLYFPDVTNDANYCAAHVVPYSDLATDLATTTRLPAYSFVSPNLCDDMHDCAIATGDA